ncbi:MAG TPA: SRPBCC family protein [Gemmatimonadaceae bacterium]|nr:SRPBCC family protein [Gemmatimonadaceae bacterium]
MKKWLFIALGALVALVGAAYWMGSRLPPDHVATVRAHFRVPPDSVYAAVFDVAAYPSWRSGVSHVEVLPERNGRRVWRESAGTSTLEYEFTVALPPMRLVSTLVTPDAGFAGRWMFHFIPEGTGTNVMLAEEGHVGNPLFRFVMHYVSGERASVERYLGQLGKRFGDTVKVERVD